MQSLSYLRRRSFDGDGRDVRDVPGVRLRPVVDLCGEGGGLERGLPVLFLHRELQVEVEAAVAPTEAEKSGKVHRVVIEGNKTQCQ